MTNDTQPQETLMSFLRKEPNTIIVAGLTYLVSIGNAEMLVNSTQADYEARIALQAKIVGDTPKLFLGMLRGAVKDMDELGRKVYALNALARLYASGMQPADIDAQMEEFGLTEERNFWIQALNQML